MMALPRMEARIILSNLTILQYTKELDMISGPAAT